MLLTVAWYINFRIVNVLVNNMRIIWDELNKYKCMFLWALQSHFYLLYIGASTSPYVNHTAARIIMKMIAAPPTDTSTYKDCRQFTFGVGILPSLVVGVTHHPWIHDLMNPQREVRKFCHSSGERQRFVCSVYAWTPPIDQTCTVESFFFEFYSRC